MKSGKSRDTLRLSRISYRSSKKHLTLYDIKKLVNHKNKMNGKNYKKTYETFADACKRVDDALKNWDYEKDGKFKLVKDSETPCFKGWLFWVYPPTELLPFYHYKSGMKAWWDINPFDKVTIMASLISISIDIYRLIKKRALF